MSGYLRTWPNSTHYIISVVAATGEVDVQTLSSAGVTGATRATDTQTTSTGCNAVV